MKEMQGLVCALTLSNEFSICSRVSRYCQSKLKSFFLCLFTCRRQCRNSQPLNDFWTDFDSRALFGVSLIRICPLIEVFSIVTNRKDMQKWRLFSIISIQALAWFQNVPSSRLYSFAILLKFLYTSLPITFHVCASLYPISFLSRSIYQPLKWM